MKSVDELRRACMALYLEVPREVADDVKVKAEAVIQELENDEFYIDCLHSGGVDNWVWYDESLIPYREKYCR